MNDELGEQISALADDELPEAERELLLRRLCDDPRLRDQWSRIHLVRDALHNELPCAATDTLSHRVMAALEAEPQPIRRRDFGRVARRLGKPLAGFAVAASVAAMALIGLQHFAGPEPALNAPAPQLAASDQPLDNQRVGTRWDQPEMGTRLNAYLVNHSEYTSGTSLQGMLNYVRIAGYDSN